MRLARAAVDRPSLVLLVAAASVLAACALDRTAIVGPGRSDAGPGEQLDGGEPTPIDAGDRDALVPPGDDGGAEPDAFVPPVDGGGCRPRCEDEVLVACVGGVETRYDCRLAEATCDHTVTGAECAGGACEAPTCSEDGRLVLSCSGGLPAMPMACDRGCADGSCRPGLSCSFPVPSTMRSGESRRFALCGAADNHDHDGSCSTIAANGEDLTVRLDVDHAGTYRIEAVDSDPDRPVDPMVYLRSVCDSESSQIDCDDDTGEGRDARLDVSLEPGQYFLVIDSVSWTDRDPNPDITYVCGQVTVTISER